MTTLTHPNYTGSWEFSRVGSRLQIALPDDVQLRIDHENDAFRLERTLRFGREVSTFSISLVVGSENEPVERGDSLLFPALEWDGEELVFLTRILRKGGTATNTVRYRLLDDGDTLVADEKCINGENSYANYWVFRKSDF